MKSFASTAAFVIGASAAAISVRDSSDSCCFGISVSGGQTSGSTGQLSDGQIRVGSGYDGSTYCLDNANSTITDENGFGCVIAQPQTQFQCDLNGTPTAGFSMTDSGELAFGGSTTFYECAVDADYHFNLYTTPGGVDCTQVTLTITDATGSCPASSSTTSSSSSSVYYSSTSTSYYSSSSSTPYYSSSSSTPYYSSSSSTPYYSTSSSTPYYSTSSSTATPSSTCDAVTSWATSTVTVTYSVSADATSTVTVTSTAECSTISSSSTWTSFTSSSYTTGSTSSSSSSTSTPTACSADLNGNYQYPHYIVPVSSQQPDTAFGTQYFGYINSINSSIFNFDIPSSYSGETCSLIFLLPLASQLETSSFTLSGDGEVSIAQLEQAATSSTDYNNVPAITENYGDFNIQAGSSTVVSTFPCPAGQTVTYELCATGTYNLTYFQDYNPSPIGLYIRQC